MLRTATSLVSLMLTLVLAPLAARAQRAPDFATLDRHDGITRVGLDLGSTFLSTPPGGPDEALRFDLWGQYVFRSGLGLYADLPLSHTVGTGSDTALGDVELGLHFVMDSPTVSLIVRGGLGLPTADDMPAPNLLGLYPRLTDYALAVPEALYGRLSLSPLWHAHRWFARLDAGLDVPLHEDTTVFDADPLVRINVAGGYDAGVVALMAEVVTLANVNHFQDNETFVHTAALSVRFMGDLVQPFVAVGLPLDQSARDTVDVFVSAGLQIMIH